MLAARRPADPRTASGSARQACPRGSPSARPGTPEGLLRAAGAAPTDLPLEAGAPGTRTDLPAAAGAPEARTDLPAAAVPSGRQAAEPEPSDPLAPARARRPDRPAQAAAERRVDPERTGCSASSHRQAQPPSTR